MKPKNPVEELLADLESIGWRPTRSPWAEMERKLRQAEERREELLGAWRERHAGTRSDRQTEEGGSGARPWQPPKGGKQRYLRWMELLWERHQTNAREEGRKQEVIDVLEGLAEISRRPVEAPRFPPWEPPR